LNPKPLCGVRVLDLTRLLPGPLATLHLADLGADVVKIEDTGAGDYAREAYPRHGDMSYYFKIINRNKRSLRLDLKQAQGVAVFLRLARDADAIIESFRPGVVDKLGIGYDAVRAINPRIVYCAITGYGQSGPYAMRAGHDLNYIGYAGVLDQIGVAGGPPALPNLQIGDMLGGAMSALVPLLAALVSARATGQGDYVDVAMTDGVLAHAIFPLVALHGGGRARPRGADVLSGGLPCYGVYATADGRHLAVAALEPKFWNLLCDTLQRPDLKPLLYADGEQGALAKAELARIFAGHSLRHWTDIFDGIDCCVTPVLTLEETLANDQIRAREMVVEVDGVPQFAPPWKLRGVADGDATPAPHAGEHSAEVLRAAGYAEAQIEALREARVI
jgi:crotonobetainyl-CoA:carnitine CoA-transferase CaiB-like acyl-CoA transferase